MFGQMQITMDGEIRDKVDMAIHRLKAFEPEDGYFVAFSGGKDSQCIYHLCKMAGVKFDAHYSVTSVDPPELIRFIKKNYPDVIWDFPRDRDGKVITMWNLIPRKLMPPTRMQRYCCAYFKESNGKGRVTVTGVRWAESKNRLNNQGIAVFQGKEKTTEKLFNEQGIEYKKSRAGGFILNDDNDEARRMVEQCYRTRKTLINPIVDWTDEDVWGFLNSNNIEHCELYDKGKKRLGCIGCPLNPTNQRKELEEYPKHKAAYIRAFDRMLKERERKNKILKNDWKTGLDVYRWWIQEDPDDDLDDEEPDYTTDDLIPRV